MRFDTYTYFRAMLTDIKHRLVNTNDTLELLINTKITAENMLYTMLLGSGLIEKSVNIEPTSFFASKFKDDLDIYLSLGTPLLAMGYSTPFFRRTAVPLFAAQVEIKSGAFEAAERIIAQMPQSVWALSLCAEIVEKKREPRRIVAPPTSAEIAAVLPGPKIEDML